MKNQLSEGTENVNNILFLKNKLNQCFKFIRQNFKCEKCTRCCVCIYNIDITETEAKKISMETGIPVSEFINGPFMKKKLYEPCIFLRDNKCSIYELRPESCRTYPFKKIEESSKLAMSHNNKLIIYQVPPKCPSMLKIIPSLNNDFGALVEFQQEEIECTKKLKKAFVS